MGGCLEKGPSGLDNNIVDILMQIVRSGSFQDVSEMNEFKLHHHISELLVLLRKNESGSGASAESYAELLAKSVESYISTQIESRSALRKLSGSSADANEFINKYEELKSKNPRDLDALICLLAKISEDEKTKIFLAQNAQDRVEASGFLTSSVTDDSTASVKSTTTMTAEELAELRDRLLQVKTSAKSSSFVAKFGQLTKKQALTNNPQFPLWLHERPHQTLDFVDDSNVLMDLNYSLGAMPLASQEHALLEDLLHCLGGIQGDYIISEPLEGTPGDRGFNVDPSIDPAFTELVTRILPICSNYSTVVRFIEDKFEFESGQVNHSLVSAIRGIIKDYLVLVAQLEYQFRQGVLTLQKLWFYLQSSMKTLELLASIVKTSTKSKAMGGALLSLLHEKMTNLTGDPKAQELCLYLTQAACVPYFEILERWIYKGIICDPFEEFLVEDNELVQKEDLPLDYSDEYWEKRYTICRERIPVFLEKVADMILRTGKYLNVVRQCGQDVKCPDAEPIAYTLKERQYVEKIEKSYSFASKKLLDLLMEENDLMGRLRSVKHYFLLDQGDFIVQFMDMAEDEMKKNIDDIMPTRLESLLELALRTSVANMDLYKDDVRVELLPYDLLFQMFRIMKIETKEEKEYKMPSVSQLSGLEAFTFSYDVKWPMSLILNRKVLACYQMLFRLLLYSKYVERSLCNVWINSKVTKSFLLSASQSYVSAFALRQRMLNFIQNLEYYMMFEVLEPNWRYFITKLQSVSNVDEVLQCQTDFLSTCLKDCMLTSTELLQIVNKLMTTCVNFSTFILKMKRYFVDAEVSCMLQSTDEIEETQSPDQSEECQLPPDMSFEQSIKLFDEEFTKNVLVLLDRISDFGRENYNDKLVNILYRIDFNGFYTERLEKFAIEKTTESMANSIDDGVNLDDMQKSLDEIQNGISG